ncbi:MAG: hypothetical protein AVDCRST_MAG66-3665, partial [uncultured Pseudonocardia sp.]
AAVPGPLERRQRRSRRGRAGCVHDHRDRRHPRRRRPGGRVPRRRAGGPAPRPRHPRVPVGPVDPQHRDAQPVRAAHRVGHGGGAHRGVPRVRALRAVARCRRPVLRRAAARRARRRRHDLLL